jgi:hypothetical protein
VHSLSGARRNSGVLVFFVAGHHCDFKLTLRSAILAVTTACPGSPAAWMAHCAGFGVTTAGVGRLSSRLAEGADHVHDRNQTQTSDRLVRLLTITFRQVRYPVNQTFVWMPGIAWP